MKRLTRILPLLLAAALQLLPLLRNIVTIPTASSSFAIILRWGIGGAATVGAYDACSGATAPYFNSPTNFTGTVGVYFTNNVVVTNVPGDPGAFFNIYCTNLLVSITHVSNNIVTTNCMPSGLTFKCIEKSGNSYYIGSVYGTPTSPITNWLIHFQAGYPNKTPVDVTNYFTINPSSSRSPPTITNQPVSLTNNVGTAASFSVTNGGTAPLSYQWYFNTNTVLLNQTNSATTLANVQLTNAGTYSVIITNSAGSVTSSFALLTVWQPPVITNQPTSITNVAGGNGTFNILVGGVPTPKYQWNFNTNTALLNATNTSLALTGLRASQAGVYTVVITNSAGSVTSSIANLVITNPNPPTMSAPVKNSSGFQFTFVPVVGLTNSVLTNNVIIGGSWGVLTNVPPPATANPITVTDPFSATNRFYRVQILP